MTPDQVMDARKLLGWSKVKLGFLSDTSIHVVQMFERTGQAARLYGRMERMDTVAAIRATLEAAGIEFTDGRVPGVRLRKLSQ